MDRLTAMDANGWLIKGNGRLMAMDDNGLRNSHSMAMDDEELLDGDSTRMDNEERRERNGNSPQAQR
jgi:hypothetical protein